VAFLVADSDVLIDALRGRDPAADRVVIGLETGSLATTVVTVFELLSGAPTREDRQPVERLLAALPVLPLDDAAGRRAAALRVALRSRGEEIGMADYLIAGICLSRSAPLLTRNVAHFSRVPELRLVDPGEP